MPNNDPFDTASQYYKHWAYKNSTLLIFSIIVFVILIEVGLISSLVNNLSSWGYIGALITGIFFVSSFTVVPAIYVLNQLTNTLHPIEIAFVAGIGAVLGDYLIFRFIRDRIFEELKPLFMKHGGRSIFKLFHTPYFAWLLPIIGALIIASPLPDEAGVSILGLSKIKGWQFVCVTFLLNTAGIFLLIIFS